jgi:hypothetical protein
MVAADRVLDRPPEGVAQEPRHDQPRWRLMAAGGQIMVVAGDIP